MAYLKFVTMVILTSIIFVGCAEIPDHDADLNPYTNTNITTTPQQSKSYIFYTRDVLVESTDDNILGLGTTNIEIPTNTADPAKYIVEEWLIRQNRDELHLANGQKLNSPVTHEEAAKLIDLEVKNGKATIDFLFRFYLAGDMSGAYIKEELRLSLTSLENIDEVEVLTLGSRCWDDLSGLCEE